ncbi:14698_t:CDS:2 [Funneliformis geosporum]|uniref:14698_t:CDS:1 n=1 Tax=Funneliformis geosporum TaxID=1117311 RepID=A0A9W4SSD3_9GLOM|nr:14698_t:CDS:2 [Funneliformis geosporum]
MEPDSNSYLVENREATRGDIRLITKLGSPSSVYSKVHYKNVFTNQSTNSNNSLKTNSSKKINKDAIKVTSKERENSIVTNLSNLSKISNPSDEMIDQFLSFDSSLISESFSAESNSNSNSLNSSDIPSSQNHNSTIGSHFLKNKTNKGIISDMNNLMDDGSSFIDYARVNPKRNRDYHNLFKEIPLNEYLINDYGCALQKEILAQGKIYVSLNYICFHANIFGWVTNTVLPFLDITAIEKKMTAFVIPNAILISTKKTKYCFASFLSRDTVYELFMKLWRHSNSDSNQKYLQVGQQNFNSDETNENSISLLKNKLITKLSLPNINAYKKGDMDLEEFAATLNNTVATEKIVNNEHTNYSSPSSPNQFYLNRNLKRSKSEDIVTKSPLTLQDIHHETICDCLKNKQHFDNLVLDTKFKGSVEKIYNLLYTSGFIAEFLTDLEKTDDTNFGEWTEYDGKLVRQASYTKRLNKAIINIGPKTTKFYVKDEVLHRDFEKYVSIMTSTKTPDVPSGSEFTIKTRTCIMMTATNKTRVIVTCTFEFSKPTWLKASLEDQIAYYKAVDTAVRKYISQNLSEFETSETSTSSIFNEAAKCEVVNNDNFYATIKQKSTKNKKTLHLNEEVTTTNNNSITNFYQTVINTSKLTNILSVIELRVPNIETIVLIVIILTLIINVYMLISLKDITHQIKFIEQLSGQKDHIIEFDNIHYTLIEWLNELRKRQLFSILKGS